MRVGSLRKKILTFVFVLFEKRLSWKEHNAKKIWEMEKT
jgi:hypothetical protein